MIIDCLNCGSGVKGKPSEGRKFCSSSCSATFNNKIRPPKPFSEAEIAKRKRYNERKRGAYKARKKNNCLHCEKITTNKFCSSRCQVDFRRSSVFRRIDEGDSTVQTRWLKKYLIAKHGEKCMECDWGKVNPISNTIPIELEHMDGNSENNHLNNLKLLCPNCHSLTPTYKSLNSGNGRASRRERYKQGKSY